MKIPHAHPLLLQLHANAFKLMMWLICVTGGVANPFDLIFYNGHLGGFYGGGGGLPNWD